jgi:hypothetical protein
VKTITDESSLSAAGLAERVTSTAVLLATNAAKAGWVAGSIFGAGVMEMIANVWSDGRFSNPYTALLFILMGGIGYPLVIRARLRSATPAKRSGASQQKEVA